MRTDRRSMIVGAAATLLPRIAIAGRADFTIDWQGAPVDPALAAVLAAQIADIRALPIDPSIIAFFGRQPIFVFRQAGIGSLTGQRGVFITRDPFPVDNPVLLHELLHRYQMLRLPGGARNPDIVRFYDDAVAKHEWPRNAYLYTNDREFFAMTASVVLHGRAARPPFLRETVRRDMPELYAWIVDRFGLRLPGVPG